MRIDLAGRVALITGGLGDIGGATARALAEAGAVVALSDLADAGAGEAQVRAAGEPAGRWRYDAVDVTDPDAVRTWVERVEDALGPPALTVVNAAVVAPAESLAIEASQWRRQLAVNLDGAFFTAQAAAKRMVERGIAGHIVFVGSWAASRPHPRMPAYSAAKAGLRMLMQCMAAELAPHGIRVNEVAPGYVDAGLSGRIFRQEPTLRERAQRCVPLGRLISAEDVARQVVLLCDPQSRHVTGHALVMDGGLSLVSPATGAREPSPGTDA